MSKHIKEIDDDKCNYILKSENKQLSDVIKKYKNIIKNDKSDVIQSINTSNLNDHMKQTDIKHLKLIRAMNLTNQMKQTDLKHKRLIKAMNLTNQMKQTDREYKKIIKAFNQKSKKTIAKKKVPRKTIAKKKVPRKRQIKKIFSKIKVDEIPTEYFPRIKITRDRKKIKPVIIPQHIEHIDDSLNRKIIQELDPERANQMKINEIDAEILILSEELKNNQIPINELRDDTIKSFELQNFEPSNIDLEEAIENTASQLSNKDLKQVENDLSNILNKNIEIIKATNLQYDQTNEEHKRLVEAMNLNNQIKKTNEIKDMELDDEIKDVESQLSKKELNEVIDDMEKIILSLLTKKEVNEVIDDLALDMQNNI
jgi:hypothetical protein